MNAGNRKVVVIAELAGHVSVAGVLGFIILFLPVWWVWIGGTFYTERFETGDLSYRVFTFLGRSQAALADQSKGCT
jgi:low temperature requirement protein LtrA